MLYPYDVFPSLEVNRSYQFEYPDFSQPGVTKSHRLFVRWIRQWHSTRADRLTCVYSSPERSTDLMEFTGRVRHCMELVVCEVHRGISLKVCATIGNTCNYARGRYSAEYSGQGGVVLVIPTIPHHDPRNLLTRIHDVSCPLRFHALTDDRWHSLTATAGPSPPFLAR